MRKNKHFNKSNKTQNARGAGTRIRIEEIFEPTLTTKVKNFLENDGLTSNIAKALLVAGVLGCVVFVGAIAPNLVAVLGNPSGKRSKISENGFYRLRKSIYYLKRKRLIEYVETKDGEDVYRFTNTGKEKIKKFIFEKMTIPKPQKWDGQMRLIMFDVPDYKRAARDALRHQLQSLECFCLQKSVWVHPFPCYEEIMYVADNFGVANNVEIVTTKDLTNPAVFKYFEYLLRDYL